VGYSNGGVLLFRGHFATPSSSSSSSSANTTKLKPPLTLWPPLPYGAPPPPSSSSSSSTTDGTTSSGMGEHPGEGGAAVPVPVVSLLFGERAPLSALHSTSSGNSSGGSSSGIKRPAAPRLFVVTHLNGHGDYGTVRMTMVDGDSCCCCDGESIGRALILSFVLCF